MSTGKQAKQPKEEQESSNVRPPIFTDSIITIYPYEYAHIRDSNTNISSLLVGPTQIRATRNIVIVKAFKRRPKSQQR
jgi:hypothetical protein